nr:hypothetical protein Ade03nite_59480 [Actinoplanes derwentensis]
MAAWRAVRPAPVGRLRAAPRRRRKSAPARAATAAADSLTQDPTVARLRAAAGLLDEDVWIAVRLPGDYEGADELGWLREALQLLAGDDQGEEADLEPL